MLFFSLALAAIVGPVPSPVRADWLYFARGGAAELLSSTRGDCVEVAAPGGIKSFPKTVFRAIVPSASPVEEWQIRRLEAEHAGSPQAWLAAAWWALERGLTTEAISTLRRAIQTPGADEISPLTRAGRMLARLDEQPVGEPDLGRIRAELGGSGWTELCGRHLVLLHQGHDRAAAAERLDVLDQVFETYYLSLAIQGIDLTMPGRRLVSVWFARQADYVAFLRRIEASPFTDTQGYYHPSSRVVFAFDTRSSARQAQGRREIDRSRLDPSPSGSASELADLDRRLLLLDLEWRSVDLGIAAHETVHQLMAASGLASRFDDLPNWIHEGFAAQFEVVRGGRWVGFGRINDQRIVDWRGIRPGPRLAPLLRDDGMTHGYHRDRYAESWAFVFFLRKTRPDDFTSFLDRLHAPRSANQDLATATVFAEVFGSDIDAIERDWRSFMANQLTPLEANASNRDSAKSR